MIYLCKLFDNFIIDLETIMGNSNLMSEHIKKDEILKYFGGRLSIKDCIFVYQNPIKEIKFQGDLNPDLKKKFLEIDTEIFSITVVKSLIFNNEMRKDYLGYRLIDIIF